RIRVENRRYELPGDVGKKHCKISGMKKHLARSCPFIEDQGCNQSPNNRVMDIQRIDIGRNNHKGSKRGSKASIRTSLGMNLININYVEKKGLTWKCLNNGSTFGGTCDEVVGYVPGLEVDVDGVKVMQKFYIKRRLSSDVVLEMPWVTKTKSTFVISEDSMFDEHLLNKDCVNIRCVKDESLEKDDVVDKKKNKVVNKSNKRESNSTKVNVKSVPKKSEFVDNGGKAADGKANDPKNGIGHQYDNGIDIGKGEVKTCYNYQKSSAMATVSGSYHGRCDEIEKKRYTRNRMLFVSNCSMNQK
ncbi:9837_t:CDS:2, partial [Gigaspora margarita]